MNYRKQLKKLTMASGNNTGMVGFALIGGLAVGAALAVLFAPKKGKALRDGISDTGKQFGGTLAELLDSLKAKFSGADLAAAEQEEQGQQADHIAAPVKKPKSDIKELIREAHKEGHAPEHHG